MFYSITGRVVHTDATSVAVDCGGVAFNCSATANTLRNIGAIGDTVTLYTYLNVREDALDMFGFYDKDELDCFKLLINVTGVVEGCACDTLAADSEQTCRLRRLGRYKVDNSGSGRGREDSAESCA